MKKQSTQDFLKTNLTSFINWIESSYKAGELNYFEWDKGKQFPLSDSELIRLFLFLVELKNSKDETA